MDYIFEFSTEDFNKNSKKDRERRKAELYRRLDSKGTTCSIYIEHIHKIPEKGVELECRIDRGEISKGDMIKYNGQPGKIESIKRSGEEISLAGYPWTDRTSTIRILISGIENETIYTGLQVIDIVNSLMSDDDRTAAVVRQMPERIERTKDEDFIFLYKNSFSIRGRVIVLLGMILKGTISIGDKITVDGKQATVIGIESFRTLKESATSEDGEIGLLTEGLRKEDAIRASVIRKVSNNASESEPVAARLSQYTASSTNTKNGALNAGSGKTNFVRTRQVVPITIAEIPNTGENKVIETIKKSNAYKCEREGTATRIETNSRIYEIDRYGGKTSGLILYVNMENLKWKLHIKGVVESYKNNCAGGSEFPVITIIKSASSSDKELRELEEMELRDSLTAMGLKGNDYPVIFRDMDEITQARMDYDKFRLVSEIISNMDSYFPAPERE